MTKYHVVCTLVFLWILPVNYVTAQVEVKKNSAVKIKVPSKEKKNTSYYFFTIGHQYPTWYNVPMIPQYPVNMVYSGKMKVQVPGWYAGIGIMKKTRTNFEVGLLGDFYKTTIPVALAGQRSTSEWVSEKRGGVSAFTDTFVNDVSRISEVYSIRASIRYKIPVGIFQFWGGIAPGTFSSKIYFAEETKSEPLKIFTATSIGLTYQAGLSLVFKNSKGKDMLRFGFYADFSSPKIEEKIISLFKPGWNYFNTAGNYVINPIRFGFTVGVH
jgi:hypothetical protein